MRAVPPTFSHMRSDHPANRPRVPGAGPVGALLDRVAAVSPERRDLIAHLLRTSAGFRALCRDHQACVATLTRLRATSPRDPDLEAEYADLLSGLAEEICEWLDQSSGEL